MKKKEKKKTVIMIKKQTTKTRLSLQISSKTRENLKTR